MRFSNAIVIRLPNSTVRFEDKKLTAKFNLQLARKQQEDLNDTLREAGINVIELPPEEDCFATSVLVDDFAVIIKGTALIGRLTGNSGRKSSTATSNASSSARVNEIGIELCKLEANVCQVLETPSHLNGKPVCLVCSDVLYTGREIFVGIRKGGTNLEGAMFVAKTFADYAVVPVYMSGNLPLKYYISMATDDVLVATKSPESQAILKRIEHESSFNYKVLTVATEDAVACINANNHLIFWHDLNEMKFRVLPPPSELWGVSVSELVKIGAPFTRFCLLIPDF